jgi:hypothetical protein
MRPWLTIEDITHLPLALFALLAACAPKGEALYARAEAALAKGDTCAPP